MILCRNHSERAAEALCSRCGDLICGLCAIAVEGIDYCPECVVKVRGDAVRFGPWIPWENRSRLGTLNAAWQTVSASFTRPQEMYERMPMTGGYTDPLLFGMLMRGMVVVVYSLLIAGFYVIVGIATRAPVMFLQAAMQGASLFVSILQAAVLMFAIAGILHLAVLLVAGGKGFERTFRVYSYGRAIDVLELIPILGLFLSTLYRIYIHFLGLRTAHSLSNNQAAGIALVPIGLWLGLVIFAVGLAVAVVLLVASIGP